MNLKLLPIPLLLVFGIVQANANIIVAESFGGSNANSLDGTTADTFDAAITTAGGLNEWQITGNSPYIRAGGNFSIPNGNSGVGYLDLGTYIDDAKGSASGKFVLQATLNQATSTTSSYGIGFKHADSTSAWWADGVATALLRTSGQTGGDFYAYHADATGSDDYTTFSGTQTFKIELDYTTWNGTTDFGTVNFYDPADLNSIAYSYDYTANYAITGLAISYGASGGDATTEFVSDLSLTQVTAAIPEPSTMMLMGLGLASVLLRRKIIS